MSPPADDGQAELDVTIELGRAELSREEMLGLRRGAVVPLDKLAGEPAEVLVNGRLFAWRGGSARRQILRPRY